MQMADHDHDRDQRGREQGGRVLERVAERFRAPEPYPEVRVAAQNPFYARVLQDDFSGPNSELTAITQYVYHHWWSEVRGVGEEDLAEMFLGFALVEMDHFDILARTIILLGGDPRYVSFAGVPWISTNVYYGEGVCDRLAANLAGERAAHDTYLQHAEMIGDPFVSALLRRFALDEAFHARMTVGAMQRHCGIPAEEPIRRGLRR